MAAGIAVERGNSRRVRRRMIMRSCTLRCRRHGGRYWGASRSERARYESGPVCAPLPVRRVTLLVLYVMLFALRAVHAARSRRTVRAVSARVPRTHTHAHMAAPPRLRQAGRSCACSQHKKGLQPQLITAGAVCLAVNVLAYGNARRVMAFSAVVKPVLCVAEPYRHSCRSIMPHDLA